MRITMARRRKSTGEDAPVSRQIRAYTDIADMLSWVIRLENADQDDGPEITHAGWIDPLIRPQITAAFRKIVTRVNEIKRVEGIADQAPTEFPETPGS